MSNQPHTISVGANKRFYTLRVRRIVMVAASQVGKSELELNIIGYIINENPGSILFIYPATIDAKEFSKFRIAPEIRDCPTLRQKAAAPKSQDCGCRCLSQIRLGIRGSDPSGLI